MYRYRFEVIVEGREKCANVLKYLARHDIHFGKVKKLDMDHRQRVRSTIREALEALRGRRR